MQKRSQKLTMRNIYVIWFMILIVFVIHTLVAITEENLIEAELEMRDDPDYNEGRWDYGKYSNVGDSDELHVTVKPNTTLSKLQNGVDLVGNVMEIAENSIFSNVTAKANNETIPVKKKVKPRGYFVKQDEFENIRVDEYRNGTRNMSCDHCFHTNFTFVSSNICNSSGSWDRVDIIVVIPTAYTHIRQRMALRTTWLSRTMKNTAKVRYAFLLGHTDVTQMQHAVIKEMEKYNDMVIANFTDTYMNLTFKTLATFHWIRTWCPQARVIVKADDDVYINLENLIVFSGKNLNPMQNSVYGGCWVREPIRRVESKYYVSQTMYANSTYPTVCSGTTYITSANVIDKILKVSPNIPFFYLEDVYVAFCMEKSGVNAKKHTGILTKVLKSDIPICAYKGPRLISAHIRNPRKIEQIWRTNCDQNKPK